MQDAATTALDIRSAAAPKSEYRLLDEIVESLSPEERGICIRVAVGFSTEQIASWSGRSPDDVDKIVERIQLRIRDAYK